MSLMVSPRPARWLTKSCPSRIPFSPRLTLARVTHARVAIVSSSGQHPQGRSQGPMGGARHPPRRAGPFWPWETSAAGRFQSGRSCSCWRTSRGPGKPGTCQGSARARATQPGASSAWRLYFASRAAASSTSRMPRSAAALMRSPQEARAGACAQRSVHYPAPAPCPSRAVEPARAASRLAPRGQISALITGHRSHWGEQQT
jgi:hypothetical protein